MSSIYESAIDPNNENNSHSFALSMIGYNKRVLEVGCSTGFMTKTLVERGCDVVGIEIDREAAAKAETWAERVVVGDVDENGTWDDVKDESFDVVVMGDVLEHLRDPLASLRQAARKLKPSGFVVTSLPNVAHGDVRMALMKGRFQYADMGLLDRTHLHFFTLQSIRRMVSEAGLLVVDTKRVVVPLFQSELGVTREDVSQKALDELHADPEVESYQYVIKSVRDNGDAEMAELSRSVTELTDRVHNQRMRIALLRQGLLDNGILHETVEGLQRDIAEHHRYVTALKGHIAGLEHNIEVLYGSLSEAEERYRAALAQRAPLARGAYNRLRRIIARSR